MNPIVLLRAVVATLMFCVPDAARAYTTEDDSDAIFAAAARAKSCTATDLDALYAWSLRESRASNYTASQAEYLSIANDEVFLVCRARFLQQLSGHPIDTQKAVGSYFALNEPERVGCALLVLHADPRLAPIIDIAFANSMARQQACAATSDE
jgi:hypothetical protein